MCIAVATPAPKRTMPFLDELWSCAVSRNSTCRSGRPGCVRVGSPFNVSLSLLCHSPDTALPRAVDRKRRPGVVENSSRVLNRQTRRFPAVRNQEPAGLVSSAVPGVGGPSSGPRNTSRQGTHCGCTRLQSPGSLDAPHLAARLYLGHPAQVLYGYSSAGFAFQENKQP
jgi:hypothetical protein